MLRVGKKNGTIPFATLEALRKTVATLQEECRRQMRSTAGVEVHAGPESPATCTQCLGPMRVRKTLRRKAQTLAHGVFLVCETVLVCAAGCTTEVILPAGGTKKIATTRRSDVLARLVLPRRTIGYDVMVFVGVERFIHHRQRHEIQATLEADHGIRLSDGEISTLARDFIVYLEVLHQQRAPALREAMAADGGWPMHIDATGEDGLGTMLTVFAGWRGWVLGSWKIPTERADAVLPRLHKVADQFGDPCAIMRDLGRAMIEASRTFVQERSLDVPILGCHFHFARDVGKDLLSESHDLLRGAFRRFKVVSGLCALTRELGRQLGTEIGAARLELERWLAEPADGDLESRRADTGLASVKALAQWVLDFQDDGQDEGFPFDLPYLDLWHRCSTALRAVEAFLRTPPDDIRASKALERLHRILEPVRSQLPFQHPARVLEGRARLFTELRQALRPQVKPVVDSQASTDLAAQAELQDVQRAVEKLADSLRARRPERGPAQDTRKAIDLILDHLDRHGPSLWGHAISLPEASGGGKRLVDRTNLLLEAFFGVLKHGERRRSGRKTLTQDLERLPGAAPLAANLTKPDYVAILCNGLDQLPAAFAALDANHRQLALPARKRAEPAGAPDIVSASLPTADRGLIRSKDLRQWLLAAARSRAPCLTPKAKQAKRSAAQ